MDDILNKKVPFSVDAEQSVLGAVLINPECFSDIAQIITSEDFYMQDHKDIFLAMHTFNLQNRSIDPITLVNELIAKGVYPDEEAARSYIRLLVDIVPGSANAKDYAKIVYEKSILRKLISASEDIQAAAYEEQDNVSTIVDWAEQKIFDIAQSNEKRDFIHIKDVITQTYERLDSLKDGPTEEALGIKTGFSKLDDYVVGFSKGDLIVVGARPGIGKTSFCLNLATNIAKRTKKAVCIFSLEMSCEQLVSRVISSEAMVDSKKMRMGTLDSSDWEKIAYATSELSETDIYIDDTTGIGLTAIKAKLRRVKNLGLVVIDYLQLMQSETKRKDGNRANELADITRGLKILAKELNVPVLVCAQLNRAADKEHKTPILSDLSDSSSTEKDADMIIFLSRDYYGDDPEKANLVDVIVAKNRHGSMGKVTMSWLGQYTKFSTLEDDSGF